MAKPDAPFHPIRSKETFEQVSGEIKNMIFAGDLRPEGQTPFGMGSREASRQR